MIVGIFRGLVREILALACWVVSIWLSWGYSDDLTRYFVTWLNSEKLSYFTAAASIFFISLFGLTLISRVICKQFRITGLTGMNRTFGALFGVARGIVVITILVFGLEFTPANEANWYKQSALIPYFSPLLGMTEETIYKTYEGYIDN